MFRVISAAWQGYFVLSWVKLLAMGEAPFNAPSILSTASTLLYFCGKLALMDASDLI